MSNVIYGLHTGETKRQITYREAKAIEMLFGTSFPDENHACSQFFKDGVSKFWISEVVNKAGKKYWLHFRINMARAIAIGDYCLMPYTILNVNKMIKGISKVLKKLKLESRNSDFGEWQWVRLDTAFDDEEALPELYMSLLDKSLDVNAHRKQCNRIVFIPANSKVCESIRFGNDSYVYNVYIKLADLINNSIVITPEILQEVKNIVRIERQNHLSAIKQLLPNGLVKDLASKSVMDAILKTLINDIEAFWGKGDYYSAYEMSVRFNGNYDVKRLIPAMVAFTKSSLEKEYSLYTPDIKAAFQDYGIMPVGICQEDSHKYQVHEIKGLYNTITNCYTVPNKRPYHVFPVPHLCSDGRYKAGITFHKVNDTRTQPVSITGRTIEDYESKVLEELKNVYIANLHYHCRSNMSIFDLMRKSANDILHFSKVVESKSVKIEVKKFIKQTNVKRFV